jgi:hypothetical protein
MSALGQKQTLHRSNVMSALRPKADIRNGHGRLSLGSSSNKPGKLLSVVIADDKTDVLFLDRPRRREAAGAQAGGFSATATGSPF